MDMTIREFAKSYGIKVVGKLTRQSKWEYSKNPYTGKLVRDARRAYKDEASNEYYIYPSGKMGIVTFDGGVI